MPRHPVTEKSSKNLTNVTIPAGQMERFKEAARHFRIENTASFLRGCALALIEHYENGDVLEMPLLFRIIPNPHEKAKQANGKTTHQRRERQ
jgi:hypothetical protein